MDLFAVEQLVSVWREKIYSIRCRAGFSSWARYY